MADIVRLNDEGHCTTCGHAPELPFRRRDSSGKITEGCIDAAHTGHLHGESLRWHNRPEAKKMRKAASDRLREVEKHLRALERGTRRRRS